MVSSCGPKREQFNAESLIGQSADYGLKYIFSTRASNVVAGDRLDPKRIRRIAKDIRPAAHRGDPLDVLRGLRELFLYHESLEFYVDSKFRFTRKFWV